MCVCGEGGMCLALWRGYSDACVCVGGGGGWGGGVRGLKGLTVVVGVIDVNRDTWRQKPNFWKTGNYQAS